jgi:hypothetical protein
MTFGLGFWLAAAAVLAVFGGLCAFAWLTRYPEQSHEPERADTPLALFRQNHREDR